MPTVIFFSVKPDFAPSDEDSPVMSELSTRAFCDEAFPVGIEDMALAELSRIASEGKDYQEVVDIVMSRKYEGRLLLTLNKQHPAHQYSAQWDRISVHGLFLTFHG